MDWTHRLRLRQLQMLLSLAQTGNMSQSAQALHTAQPALSKWLKELEEDLGFTLFERHARGLRPTPQGEALIAHARRIEAHLDSARDDMQALRDGGSGLVVVGTSGASASDVVPMAVLRLLEWLPRAQVRLAESTMNVLMRQLATGELDVVVVEPQFRGHRRHPPGRLGQRPAGESGQTDSGGIRLVAGRRRHGHGHVHGQPVGPERPARHGRLRDR